MFFTTIENSSLVFFTNFVKMDLDPVLDPHSEKLVDLVPQKLIADPQHWPQESVLFQRFLFKKMV